MVVFRSKGIAFVSDGNPMSLNKIHRFTVDIYETFHVRPVRQTWPYRVVN